MKNTNIPYGKQFIDNDDVEIVKNSLRSSLITTGPYVKNFENKIKNIFKCKYALACNNGTAGLHLAFQAVNLKKNDVVIMPVINFISAYRIANLMGLKVYFADVDEFTGQMTPLSLLNCIKKNKLKKIKAVLTMYLGGFPENIIEFYKIKKKFKFFLIEDAFHAFGSQYNFNEKKYYVGSCKHADISVFSFHPVKTITTGEGGVVTTNNLEFAKKISELRSHGIIRKKEYWKYDIKQLGYNYRLSDINAALGISQIKKINKFIVQRKKIYLFYKKKLKKYFKFPDYNLKNINSYHLCIISINFTKIKKNKDNLFKFLNKKKIYPQYHYIPISKFSFYKKKSKTFKNSENYYKNSISIPIYYNLKKNEQIYIIKNLLRFLKN